MEDNFLRKNLTENLFRVRKEKFRFLLELHS